MAMFILVVHTLILGFVEFLLCLLFLITILLFNISFCVYPPFAIGISALLVFTEVASLFFTMENLLTLLLPSWSMEEPGETHTRGFDAIGKRILSLFVRLCELFPVIFLAGNLYDRIESFGDAAI